MIDHEELERLAKALWNRWFATELAAGTLAILSELSAAKEEIAKLGTICRVRTHRSKGCWCERCMESEYDEARAIEKMEAELSAAKEGIATTQAANERLKANLLKMADRAEQESKPEPAAEPKPVITGPGVYRTPDYKGCGNPGRVQVNRIANGIAYGRPASWTLSDDMLSWNLDGSSVPGQDPDWSIIGPWPEPSPAPTSEEKLPAASILDIPDLKTSLLVKHAIELNDAKKKPPAEPASPLEGDPDTPSPEEFTPDTDPVFVYHCACCSRKKAADGA